MTNILADLPCPRWCRGDLPTDGGGVIHLSGDRDVATTAGPALTGFIHVSVERLDVDADHIGSPAIRIEGYGDQMTPIQAFELASTLQAAAISALMEGATR